MMMQTRRHTFSWTIVALVAMALGSVLLSAQATFHTAGLMLMLYGVVLLWWRVEAAMPIVQARVARIAHQVREQAFR